jgi:hypothetical protein
MKKTLYLVVPKNETVGKSVVLLSIGDALKESKKVLSETMELAVITEIEFDGDKVLNKREVTLSIVATAVEK